MYSYIVYISHISMIFFNRPRAKNTQGRTAALAWAVSCGPRASPAHGTLPRFGGVVTSGKGINNSG